ncbi:hypothetical protein ALC56_06593 [Trachymyrmex septentrionalis]|uniref:Uncharacterized protein n=1 Tax=Trachymyrmex septentrionalis TaxID=34720 RepID=A0A195FG20_9HYME|nr:hypothetical protein ALC56_06593 [Trachymyrmex septentrionalis]
MRRVASRRVALQDRSRSRLEKRDLTSYDLNLTDRSDCERKVRKRSLRGTAKYIYVGRYETYGKDASRQWQDTPLYPGPSQARNPRGFKTPRCSPNSRDRRAFRTTCRRPAVFLPDHRGTRALEHALSRALFSAMPPLPPGAAPLNQFILLSFGTIVCHLVSPQSAVIGQFELVCGAIGILCL